MSSQQPEIADAPRQAKIDELIKHIEEIVAHNLPDEMTNRTMDPMYSEIAVKGVTELGYRDTRHFCESFPDKFQVTDIWENTTIIALRSAVARVKPAYMTNPGVTTAVRLECDCFVRPEQKDSHVCIRCPKCNMKGHLVEECPYMYRSAVLDVNAWMTKADELVKIVESLVDRNLPDDMTQSTIDPQYNLDIAQGVVELGYRDVRHFCESFPAKFQVNGQSGVISLRKSKSRAEPAMSFRRGPAERETPENYRLTQRNELISLIEQAVAFNWAEVDTPNNVDPQRNHFFASEAKKLGYDNVKDFCAAFPDKFHINAQTGIITIRSRAPNPPNPFPALAGQEIYLDSRTGAWLKNRKASPPMNTDNVKQVETAVENLSIQEKPAKMEEKIHFKITHAGATRRFALSRNEPDLLSALKARVLKITGTNDIALFWKDEDSLIILEGPEDLDAAIDFAETQNKLACVVLETAAEKKEEKKQEAKSVSSEEAAASFNGCAYLCDACDCYLSPSNGGRFKCMICDNYDLCAACLAKGAHDNHAFVRLLNGETEIPLQNEAGGVLSMQTRDAPRCNPTFVVKGGPGLKGADKVLIDVIDSVGRHVGKKMYDTAEWLKKEAEKMKARRDEAEVEEQKMVEEIIRREREEETKRWKKRTEDRKRQEEMRQEEELAKKARLSPDAENGAVDLKTKLEQLEKDRRMAEQMWREEKKQWKGTRRHFKKEMKHLRKEEKIQSRVQKREPKPEEKASFEEEAKKFAEAVNKVEPKPEHYQPLHEISSSDDSSVDSDMELLEKPAEKSEKNDSIVSDLVILDDQKKPTAADLHEVASLQKQAEALLQQQQQPLQALTPEQQFAAAAAALPTPPAEAPQQPRQQQSIYPELPAQSAFTDRFGSGRRGFGFEPVAQRAEAERELARQEAEVRAEREARWRAERESRRMGRSWADNAAHERRRLSEEERKERLAALHAARDAEYREHVQKAKEAKAERDALYSKAERMPAVMEQAVLAELETAKPETMADSLAANCFHLEKNTHSRQKHERVFSEDETVDNDLIQLVAVRLTQRLRAMLKVVRNSSPLERARMINNRLHELRNALTPVEDKFDYEGKANELRTILLTSKYTIHRPFGFGALPFENLNQGFASLMDQTGLGSYLSNFMPLSPPQQPYTTPRYPAPYSSGGDAIPMPPPPPHPTAFPQAPYFDAAAAAAAAQAAAAANAASTAASVAAATTAAAAAASAPAMPDTAEMTSEQHRVLRQLFETGMFEDYDRMVKVCRKAADLNEAIDMMLQ